MQAEASDPISILRDMEIRAKGGASVLPRAQAPGEVWRGIGFSVGEQRLVASMSDISEVMHCPKLARVPGAKDWLMGIANLRGNLLPVVNLSGFLCNKMSPLTKDSRALIIKQDEILSGLVVDQVFGVKHFLDEHRLAEAQASEEWLAPYVDGDFQIADERWKIFDVHALIGAPAFMQVAA
jgi:twitching motility protein PilI